MNCLKKSKLYKRIFWAVLVLGFLELVLIWQRPMAQLLNHGQSENQKNSLSHYHPGLSSKITPKRSFLTDYGQDQLTQISFEFKANNQDEKEKKEIGSQGLFFSTSDDVSKGIDVSVSPQGQVLILVPLLNGQVEKLVSQKLAEDAQRNYLDGRWHSLKISAWNGHELKATLDGVLVPVASSQQVNSVINYEVGEIKIYPYDFFRNLQAENTQMLRN